MNPSDRVRRERGLRSAVLTGDEHAWRTWYDESYQALATYVSWRCAGLRDLTEEIVQETWMTAVRRIRSFDPNRADFAGWLRGIAANLLRNHLRSQARRGRATYLGNGQHLESAGSATERERHERAERITRALANLPEHYESVLRAKYLDQMSVNQIAETCQQSSKAIESLLTRARQAFREAYGKQE
jgi:RNA polymerase sigma-70 factor (ECF subfamily)